MLYIYHCLCNAGLLQCSGEIVCTGEGIHIVVWLVDERHIYTRLRATVTVLKLSPHDAHTHICMGGFLPLPVLYFEVPEA